MPTFRSQDIPDLHDQVIIVTGGNVGLGYETIRQLSEHHPARIYLAARSRSKAEQAIAELTRASPSSTNIIRFLQLDLASFDSVKAAAAEFLRQESRIDILINNAGIMMTREGLTQDGYEIQFGTNVLGPALFTQLLLPTLRSTTNLNRQTRMVMLSSAAHARAPSDVYKFDELRTTAPSRHTTERYTTSKLANLHYARALAERETEVKIIPVHPGMVATNLHHASTGTFLKPFLSAAVCLAATPVEKGALSQIFAAVSPEVKHGQYYGPIGKAEAGSKLSQNHDLQEELFRWVQGELVGHVDTVW
ncbi:short chain dehydrogenase [Aspergillus aculeatinus CBS 121060]|uniref:Short chain dehydrogenase n=1 Tax=Aspergillus aculeatinus CBS 121060 TaxID=1448322 RepID=A0ACD1H944_9EURO|nr:short chain dehydrogenase [Aspergillus aculeatinus CBS 121060]RAH69910.1 short chain dehydrogenase [Aspergillus aculeatinus CBS 121060]